MRTRPFVAAAVAALSFLTSGVAHATAYRGSAGCSTHSMSQADVTGADTYVGVARGVAVLYDLDDLTRAVGATLRCDVYVNGELVASTPALHGTAVVATAGTVSFRAAPYDMVEVCADVVFDDGTELPCGFPHCQWCQVNPVQEAIDRVNEVAVRYVDPLLCPVLAGLPNPAVDSQGDVYVGGTKVWDCPPYDSY